MARNAQALRKIVRPDEQHVYTGNLQNLVDCLDAIGAFHLQHNGDLGIGSLHKIRNGFRGVASCADERVEAALPQWMEAGRGDSGSCGLHGRDLRYLHSGSTRVESLLNRSGIVFGHSHDGWDARGVTRADHVRKHLRGDGRMFAIDDYKIPACSSDQFDGSGSGKFTEDAE